MNTASLQSMIMQQNPITPEVWMPCCKIFHTDRYPYTVTDIISKSKIRVKPNEYKVIDYYGERYRIGAVIENSPGEIVTLRSNGRWVREGSNSSRGIAFAMNTHHMRPVTVPTLSILTTIVLVTLIPDCSHG